MNFTSHCKPSWNHLLNHWNSTINLSLAVSFWQVPRNHDELLFVCTFTVTFHSESLYSRAGGAHQLDVHSTEKHSPNTASGCSQHCLVVIGHLPDRSWNWQLATAIFYQPSGPRSTSYIFRWRLSWPPIPTLPKLIWLSRRSVIKILQRFLLTRFLSCQLLVLMTLWRPSPVSK